MRQLTTDQTNPLKLDSNDGWKYDFNECVQTLKAHVGRYLLDNNKADKVSAVELHTRFDEEGDLEQVVLNVEFGPNESLKWRVYSQDAECKVEALF